MKSAAGYAILGLMTQPFQRLWTLTDYCRFLRHPEPLIRGWAAERIEQQYPRQAAKSFSGLLADPDRHLQITAARAIGDSGDARYEPALWAVFPQSQGAVRNWLLTALGQLRTPALLPELITLITDAPPHSPAGEAEMLALRSVLEALGNYPGPAAQAALWQFIERYQDDDRLAYTAVQSLLRQAGGESMPRLVRVLAHLQPGSEGWWRTGLALVEPIGLESLAREASALLDEPDELLFLLDDWFQEEISYSEAFEDAYDEAVRQQYAGLLPHLLAEFERVAGVSPSDLPAGPPGSYRWRMFYTRRLLTALVEQPPPQPEQYRRAVALGLAALAQALIDQDDEAQLRAAPNELIRQAVLLSILGAPRQNVLPDVVGQVAALGAGVMPHLIEMLEGETFWAKLRALQVIGQLAQARPGAIEAAIPVILALIDDSQSDYILEAAETALLAIGPAVIVPAAAGLGQVDYVYDIYLCSVIANIPTLASAEALLRYFASKGAIEEHEVEALADLGHPAAIPYLRDGFEWRDDVLLCTALYKLALLTGYRGREVARWQAVAVADYARFMRHFDPATPAPPAAEAEPQPPKSKWTLARAKRQQQKKKRR